MKICIISKYPPIEGGVSAKTYWLAKALGEKGHKVFVVTNAWEVEDDYREEISKDELSYLEPKNVEVYSTQKKGFRSPITLRSDYYTEKLTTLAVNVIRKKKADVIYSYYILPYSIAGFITKKITKTPHVLRHAGSDIGILYQSPFLQTIFLEVFKDADRVVGGDITSKAFEAKGLDTGKINKINDSINPEFNPHVKPFDLSPYIKDLDVPIFSYFGKISPLKKTYSLIHAANAMKSSKDRKFILLFVVGNGQAAKELKKYVASVGLKDKCVFLPFQAPWKIPSIMKASTCIVAPESGVSEFLSFIYQKRGTRQKNDLFVHFSRIVKEAMACGKCAIMGREMAKIPLYTNLTEKNDVLIVDPNNINEFKDKLEYVIDNPSAAEKIGRNARKISEKVENVNQYIKEMENVLSFKK